jgi:hypothetical protein
LGVLRCTTANCYIFWLQEDDKNFLIRREFVNVDIFLWGLCNFGLL